MAISFSLLLALLVACVGDGSGAPSTARPLSPSSSDPALTVERGPPSPDVIRALRSVAGPQQIEVVDLALLDDEGFALARIGDQGDVTFGWIERTADGWMMGDLTEPTAWEPPRARSNRFDVAPVASPNASALIGFADPTVTRLESIGPSGELVDQREIDAGGFVLISQPWGQVRAFRRQVLVAASGVGAGPYRATREVHEGASSAATGFLEAIRSGRLREASKLLSADVPDDEFIPLFRDLIEAEIAEVGEPRADGVSVALDVVTTRGRRGLLSLHMSLEGAEWKVWQYTFAVEPS